MTTLTVTEARGRWSKLVDRVAFKGERIILRRNGKDVVALVSADDANLLQVLEDRLDLEEAERRLNDGQTPLPYEEVRAQLGLD